MGLRDLPNRHDRKKEKKMDAQYRVYSKSDGHTTTKFQCARCKNDGYVNEQDVCLGCVRADPTKALAGDRGGSAVIDMTDEKWWDALDIGGSKTGGKTGGKTGSYTYKPCPHDGTIRLTLGHEGKQVSYGVSAGYSATRALIGNVDRILDAGNILMKQDFSGEFASETPRAKVLNAAIPRGKGDKDTEWVRLNWPDMKAPSVNTPNGPIPVPTEFWRRVHAMSKPGDHVVICCMGGHGRSGTLMSSLLVVVGEFSAYDAITWVRANHCEKAVESKVQFEYLEWLEDQVTNEKKAAAEAAKKKVV